MINWYTTGAAIGAMSAAAVNFRFQGWTAFDAFMGGLSIAFALVCTILAIRAKP